jgi:hypothetical protein
VDEIKLMIYGVCIKINGCNYGNGTEYSHISVKINDPISLALKCDTSCSFPNMWHMYNNSNQYIVM